MPTEALALALRSAGPFNAGRPELHESPMPFGVNRVLPIGRAFLAPLRRRLAG